jgi:predicted O-methyltransferase YrrM
VDRPHSSFDRSCETPAPAELLASLDDPYRTALVSMYDGRPQWGQDGFEHPLNPLARISPAQGMWIYQLCRQVRPSATLETGLAYGFSTIFFLAARQKNDLGNHTAIDPLQLHTPGWAGIGLEHGRRFGGEHFQFLEETSATALARLAHEGRRFEVIFIDGSHLFDDVMLDFTLGALLCPPDGHIILDDTSMPAIQRAVSFVRTNRLDFVEVPTPAPNTAVFRRIGRDTRPWYHFVEF